MTRKSDRVWLNTHRTFGSKTQDKIERKKKIHTQEIRERK